ncbi:hypothetical protein OG21DRAFT_1490828 [Imleria badia]|nr:hypothetical protein OG21DRAFT_1490828 [Imleria badia]
MQNRWIPGERGRYKPTDFDMNGLRSTLKQFVRDWSEDVSRVKETNSHAPLLIPHPQPRTESIGEHTIYPYIHSFSNIPCKDALLRPVKIPVVLPSNLLPESDFPLGSCTAPGNFKELEDTDESEPRASQWDTVLTCSFTDANIVNYLRVIHRILAPGGVWINLGPLSWHSEKQQYKRPVDTVG